ncbi:MAG TPA: hypothetical protein PLK41_04475 [Defluviitoga tunisiensis]|nr:hypothetical protein [Defluviitoga tunisiensis]
MIIKLNKIGDLEIVISELSAYPIEIRYSDKSSRIYLTEEDAKNLVNSIVNYYLNKRHRLTYITEDFVKYIIFRAINNKEAQKDIEKYSMDIIWQKYRKDFINYIEALNLTK